MLGYCNQRVLHNAELRWGTAASCGEPAQENERIRRAAWRGSNIEVRFSQPQGHHYFHGPWPLVHERVRCDIKSYTVSEVPEVPAMLVSYHNGRIYHTYSIPGSGAGELAAGGVATAVLCLYVDPPETEHTHHKSQHSVEWP